MLHSSKLGGFTRAQSFKTAPTGLLRHAGTVGEAAGQTQKPLTKASLKV